MKCVRLSLSLLMVGAAAGIALACSDPVSPVVVEVRAVPAPSVEPETPAPVQIKHPTTEPQMASGLAVRYRRRNNYAIAW